VERRLAGRCSTSSTLDQIGPLAARPSALAASADRKPHDAARPPGALRAGYRVEREEQTRELRGLALLAAIPEQGRHGFCIDRPPPARDPRKGGGFVPETPEYT